MFKFLLREFINEIYDIMCVVYSMQICSGSTDFKCPAYHMEVWREELSTHNNTEWSLTLQFAECFGDEFLQHRLKSPGQEYQ